jgi:hypothetical protein
MQGLCRANAMGLTCRQPKVVPAQAQRAEIRDARAATWRLGRCDPAAPRTGLRSGKTALSGTLVGRDTELEIKGRGVAQSGTGCT